MIKLKNIIGLPTLEWHLNNKRTLSENVYRYSSESFIQLFTEARQAWRDDKIQLNEFDDKLLRETDIGLYGEYEGQKVPLDLPMLNESKYEKEETIQQTIDRLKARLDDPNDGMNVPFIVQKIKDLEKSLNESYDYDEVAQSEFGMDYDQLGSGEKEWVRDEIDNMSMNEAEYQGKDVSLNKPKRGGSKKFYVYVKNKKGNVQKVSFGGTTGLNVKIDEPGARSSFAARHKCATKKDKTKPGYWSCNIGRYWKSLGGSRNFSGYW